MSGTSTTGRSLPRALLARHETREIVRSCIDRLPETHRTMLILRDVEELSTEEAAALVGITEGAAKLRLHRARLALRGLLAPFFEPPRPSRSSPPPVTPA